MEEKSYYEDTYHHKSSVIDDIKFKTGNFLDFLSTPAGLGFLGVLAAIGLICFLAIPVTREYEVDKTRWTTEIQLYSYNVCRESQWSSVPEGAYDIDVRREVHHHRRVKTGSYRDSNGNSHNIYSSYPVYRDRYYYSINRWEKHSSILNYGFNDNPVEGECKYEVSPPEEIGNIRRQSGFSTEFEVIVNFGDSKKTFELDRDEWKKIVNETNPTIECKKYRFGKTIWDIQLSKN